MTIFRVRTALYSRRGDRLRTVAIHLLALVTLSTASFDAQAQSAGSIRRIGYVRSGTADIDPYRTSFVRGMRELGYFEGRNVAYEFRYYGDHADATLSGIINDLVHAKVEIIVIGGSAAIRSAQGITRTIPIVMSAAADPLASGLVESLARPGGNTTGVAFMSAELTVKRLELLKEILPETTRVGVLRNPDNPAHLSIMTSAELATVPLGLTLRSFDVRGSDQLESNFAEMKSWPADAVVVLDDSVFISQRAAIAAQAKSKRLALVCGIRELIEGCLLSYAANIGDMYFRSASYVDRILKGAKPGDLPVQQPVTFDLLINLKIAKAFGLTVPAVIARPRRRGDRIMRDQLARRRLLQLSFASLLASGLAGRSAFGQTWPNRTIRLIAPFPAGGGTDSAARIVAARLSELLGQQVVIDNRPGAGSNIGAEAAARSAPDGYTMLLGAPTLAINRFLYASLGYNSLTDLAPVSLLCRFPNILAVSMSSPVMSVRDFIDHAKANPGKVDLFLSRHRHHAAPVRRIVQTHGRHRAHPCALPWRGGRCRDRRHRRPYRFDIQHHRLSAADRPHRPTARARRDHGAAVPGGAGAADDRRIRRAGVRRIVVVCAVYASQDPDRHHRQGQRRDRQGAIRT